MTALKEEMFRLFDRPDFSFKKLKEQYPPEEVAMIKDQFKKEWRVWKQVQLNVSQQLTPGLFAKTHIERWTNGWNIREHFWASYRLAVLAEANPCIGVMLDRKQLKVYLMFQHYRSDHRHGTPAEFNLLLTTIPEWSQGRDTADWYLWDQSEMKLDPQISLTDYLNDRYAHDQFDQQATKSSFMLGKFAFRDRDCGTDMESFIEQSINALVPLYQKLI